MTQSRPIWAAADGPHNLAKVTRNIVGDRLYILVANGGVSKSATIGGVVAFLASDDARWITGDTIHVDGGDVAFHDFKSWAKAQDGNTLLKGA